MFWAFRAAGPSRPLGLDGTLTAALSRADSADGTAFEGGPLKRLPIK